MDTETKYMISIDKENPYVSLDRFFLSAIVGYEW